MTAAAGPISSGEHRPLLENSESSTRNEASEALHEQDKDRSPVEVLSQEQDFFPKLAATMINFWVQGVALAAIGALLPQMEDFYKINDLTIAFVFPSAVTGYLCAAVACQWVHVHLGRRGLAVLSSAARLAPGIVLSTGPPFPFVLIALFVFGFGTGLTDSAWCAWASTMPYANVVNGFLHSSFGIGCIIGPISVALLIGEHHPWYMFYRMLLMLLFVEFLVQVWAFRRDSASRYRNSIVSEEIDVAMIINPLKLDTIWTCGALYFVYVAIEKVRQGLTLAVLFHFVGYKATSV